MTLAAVEHSPLGPALPGNGLPILALTPVVLCTQPSFWVTVFLGERDICSLPRGCDVTQSSRSGIWNGGQDRERVTEGGGTLLPRGQQHSRRAPSSALLPAGMSAGRVGPGVAQGPRTGGQL